MATTSTHAQLLTHSMSLECKTAALRTLTRVQLPPRSRKSQETLGDKYRVSCRMAANVRRTIRHNGNSTRTSCNENYDNNLIADGEKWKVIFGESRSDLPDNWHQHNNQGGDQNHQKNWPVVFDKFNPLLVVMYFRTHCQVKIIAHSNVTCWERSRIQFQKSNSLSNVIASDRHSFRRFSNLCESIVNRSLLAKCKVVRSKSKRLPVTHKWSNGNVWRSKKT